MKPSNFGATLAATKAFLLDDSAVVPTGYTELDTLIRGGLRAKHVTQLLGRTAVGKTTLALNMLVNATLQGHSTGIVTLEMSAEEVALRALSILNGWSLDKTEEVVKSPDPALLAESLTKFHSLSIADQPRPSWDQIGEWVESLENRPRLVLLDHLKLMARYGYPRGEVERVQQLAEDAKKFAKDADVALLVLHQVGRQSEQGGQRNHGDEALTMESGFYGGEQDADVIFGMYREDRNPELDAVEREAVRGQVTLQLIKNRYGPDKPDGWKLKWQHPTFRIVEEYQFPEV